MRILFLMRHPGYIRNFESTLRLLAERGHEVHLAFEMRRRNLPSQDTLLANIEQVPGITHGPAPKRDRPGWIAVATQLRRALDYMRFLEPEFSGSLKLLRRAEGRAPDRVRRVAAGTIGRSRFGRRLLWRTIDAVEHRVPISPSVDRFLRQLSPDVVLVTPLVELGAPQTDYVRRARALGLRCGLCVASWDNLTVKGVIHDPPDLVTVWNEPQRQEAIRLHRVPAERVVITGAQNYDHWFEWRPSLDRAEFCAKVGLPPDRPYLLYVCSSPFIAPDEAVFVREWLTRLRAHPDASLARTGVLIRPHPQHAVQWRDVDISHLDAASVWPQAGADPVDVEAKSDFYDSMFHAAAAVGVNTSALIESAVVGRPAHTLLAPEFDETQRGVPHFAYLSHPDWGVLEVAESFDQQAVQLAHSVFGSADGADRRRRFLETIVRPGGLDRPATPKLVAAIEALGRQPAPPAAKPRRAELVVRRLLWPWAEAEARKARQRAAKRKKRVATRKAKLAKSTIPERTP